MEVSKVMNYVTKEELGIYETIDYYENEILNTRLFDLDREQQYVAYRSEMMKLTENLYKYVVSSNPTEYREYGCEIFEVITDCIKAFDKNKGRFINYFNRSWANRKKKIFIEKEDEEKYHTLEISDETKRTVRKIVKYAQIEGIDLNDRNTIKKISYVLDLPEKKVDECIKITQINVTTDMSSSSEGESFSVFDFIEANVNVEEQVSEIEQIESILYKIDNKFIKKTPLYFFL